jgi:hypothetical protein
MMKEKILILAKKMSKIYKDELLIIFDEDKSEIENDLQELINEGDLQEIGNDVFAFVRKNEGIVKNIDSEKLYQVKIPDFDDQKGFSIKVDDENFLEKYNDAPYWIKKKAYKYLKLLKETECLLGKKLDEFVKNWNCENYDLKTTSSAIYKIRKIIKNYGSEGLLVYACHHKRTGGMIDQELYSIFKDLYLKYNGPSLRECVEKVKEEYFKNNPSIPEDEFPANYIFLNRLKKEYTNPEIDNIRNSKVIEEFQNVLQYKNIISNFLNSEDFLCRSKTTQIQYIAYLYNHIIPYFGELEIKDITSDKIKEFEKYKFEQGFKKETIEAYVNALKMGINYYYKSKLGVYKYYKNGKNFD